VRCYGLTFSDLF